MTRLRRAPIRSANTDVVVAGAYDARAAEYIEVAGDLGQMDPADRDLIIRWRDDTRGPVLDAGCGPGVWSGLLHDRGDDEVVGIDLSGAFVADARRRHPGLSFTQGSFRDLPYEGARFGGILAWYSLIHTRPEEAPEALAEFRRVLRPGGSLLIGYFDGPQGEEFAHAVAPAWFWSAEGLGRLLRAAGCEPVFHERRERGADEASARPHGAVIARAVDASVR